VQRVYSVASLTTPDVERCAGIKIMTQATIEIRSGNNPLADSGAVMQDAVIEHLYPGRVVDAGGMTEFAAALAICTCPKTGIRRHHGSWIIRNVMTVKGVVNGTMTGLAIE
jgi:hypothetical protein